MTCMRFDVGGQDAVCQGQLNHCVVQHKLVAGHPQQIAMLDLVLADRNGEDQPLGLARECLEIRHETSKFSRYEDPQLIIQIRKPTIFLVKMKCSWCRMMLASESSTITQYRWAEPNSEVFHRKLANNSASIWMIVLKMANLVN